MPLGSSSEAPVIKPGPSNAKSLRRRDSALVQWRAMRAASRGAVLIFCRSGLVSVMPRISTRGDFGHRVHPAERVVAVSVADDGDYSLDRYGRSVLLA